MIVCPKCNKKMIRKGKEKGKQRYKCSSCGYKTINPDIKDISCSEIIQDNEMKIVTESYSIKTLDQLLIYSKVDTKKWKVKKHIVNSWGSFNNPCFQVKAWLERRLENDIDIEEQRRLFISDAKKHAPKTYKRIKRKNESGNLLEINIPDVHFGMLTWENETGENYDIKIAKERVENALDEILERSFYYQPEKIIYIVGSDFFNVDNMENKTSNGTLQVEDGRWQKTYTEGRKLLVKCIDKCMNIADVEVIVIYGNHDKQRAYYLGDSLECWYRNCANVNVNNNPSARKYYKWGSSLIGWTHGKNEKKDRLPMLMASEEKKHWGSSKYCEFHIGHTHHRDVKELNIASENVEFRIVTVSSLCSKDNWHSEKGFKSLKEATGFIWNKDKGNIVILNAGH